MKANKTACFAGSVPTCFVSFVNHDAAGRQSDGIRLAVRVELELESLFLARDIDDKGSAHADVVRPYCAHNRRDRELADIPVLPFDIHHRNFAYGDQQIGRAHV